MLFRLLFFFVKVQSVLSDLKFGKFLLPYLEFIRKSKKISHVNILVMYFLNNFILRVCQYVLQQNLIERRDVLFKERRTRQIILRIFLWVKYKVVYMFSSWSMCTYLSTRPAELKNSKTIRYVFD